MTANSAAVFVDDPIEEGCGEQMAIATPTTRLTYRELRALTDRAGQGLRRLGVSVGHRVALLLHDGPEFAASFFAAIKLGAVAVPINTRLGAADAHAILVDSGARAVVAETALGGALRASPGALGIEPLSFDDLVSDADAAPLAAEPVGLDAMAFWLYTSGTTGFPKAAVHSHRTLLACRHYGLDVLGMTAADRVFATSKLFFAYALGNALLIPLFARARTYLHPGWPDPGSVGDVMRAHRPTVFFSVPTLYARLLRSDLPPDTFASVRCCVSAGERLPAETHRAWRERFGAEILDGIGATETVFMVLANRPERSRPGSSGVPVPGTQARILDGEGREVVPGVQGVLWVRTPSRAIEYWGHAEHSRRAFVGEWFRTGDIYERDADGYYHHCGREDDFFKVAGQWVSPASVESMLLRHPDVAEAGVVGAEERGGLVKPFAFVVPRDASAPTARLRTELLALLGEVLRPHERPRDVVIVAELPRTATGKLQRFKLRALVYGGSAPGCDSRS
ncbi:MAG TPA: benzoate-CoA ligase family protein [Candidatus Methylomirabilis sp.]|nr:benzoate-CoA ligase family protein [Candidatus Methylomirabilis sp.]